MNLQMHSMFYVGFDDALLQVGQGGTWQGGHMWGTGWGWMMAWMVVLGLVGLLVLVGLPVLVVYLLDRPGKTPPDEDNAIRTLREAYARGDISDEEYEARRARLTGR